MHELSLCLALLEQVQKIADEHQARRVVRIVVQMGPLSGVEARLLQQAYPLAAAGSIAEAAELVIETCPVRVECTQCSAVSEVVPNRLLCSQCGDYRTRVQSGDELLLAHVELNVVREADITES